MISWPALRLCCFGFQQSSVAWVVRFYILIISKEQGMQGARPVSQHLLMYFPSRNCTGVPTMTSNLFLGLSCHVVVNTNFITEYRRVGLVPALYIVQRCTEHTYSTTAASRKQARNLQPNSLYFHTIHTTWYHSREIYFFSFSEWRSEARWERLALRVRALLLLISSHYHYHK